MEEYDIIESFDSDLSTRSQSCYILSIEGSKGSRIVLDWGSRRQTIASFSSAVAELFGMSYAVSESLSFIGFLQEQLALDNPPILAGDNVAALKVIRKGWSPAQRAYLTGENSSRRRTAVLRCRYLSDCLAAGLFRIAYVGTNSNLADGGTKSLGRVKFNTWRQQLGVCASTVAFDNNVTPFEISYLSPAAEPPRQQAKSARVLYTW